MFSVNIKRMIAEKIQEILKGTRHPELPEGEIQFLLHVDGEAAWSWANIRNNNPVRMNIPDALIDNMTAGEKE